MAFMSWRKQAVGKSRDGFLQGEQVPWHDCQYYEKRSRHAMNVYKKTKWVPYLLLLVVWCGVPRDVGLT